MTNPNDQAIAVGCGRHAMGDCGCALGLTKHEYFAAMAMHEQIHQKGYLFGTQEIARRACEMADALIAELNKEPK